MQDNRKHNRGKQIGLTIWLVLAICACGGVAVYAAYTSTHTAKSVIATRGGSGLPFSSNYLTIGSAETAVKSTVSINSDLPEPTIYVTVCNYPQDNPAKFYGADIPYTLTATLVDANGMPYAADAFPDAWYTEYGVVYQGTDYTFDDSLSFTLTGLQLDGYEQSTDRFALYYPQSQFQKRNVFIKLVASPALSRDGISVLSGYLGISPKDVKEITGWRGGFSDSRSEAPALYDGFNYQISGSGEADITLTWDTRYVTLSKWFLEELSDERGMQILPQTVAGNVNLQTITFSVNSGQTNSYRLQFYRTCAANPREEWSVDGQNNQICVLRQDDDSLLPYVTFSAQVKTPAVTDLTTTITTVETTT